MMAEENPFLAIIEKGLAAQTGIKELNQVERMAALLQSPEFWNEWQSNTAGKNVEVIIKPNDQALDISDDLKKNALNGLNGIGLTPNQIEKFAERASKSKLKIPAQQSLPIELPKSSNQVQLPLWPDQVRGVPNSFLRTALFGAVKKGRRKNFNKELISSVQGIEVVFSGEQLDQNDMTVWDNIIHMIRFQSVIEGKPFKKYQYFKLNAITDTGKNRKVLDECISRLVECKLKVNQGKFKYEGSLILEVVTNKETGEKAVMISPTLLDLYQPDQFTMIEWNIRKELQGKQLAQWLHGFYSSHARPYPISVEKLHQLCGSDSTEPKSFKQELKLALDALEKACAKYNNAFSYSINENLVVVSKTPSESQQRHLKRKEYQLTRDQKISLWRRQKAKSCR